MNCRSWPIISCLIFPTQFSVSSNALADVNLVSSGWLEHELDVVYCNNEHVVARVVALTPGRFIARHKVSLSTAGVSRNTAEFKIAPNKCGSGRFLTSENSHIFHAIAGDKIKVLSFNHAKSSIFASDSAKNLIFLLIGVLIGGVQELMRKLFAAPTYAIKLWFMYNASRSALRRKIDDPLKGFVMDSELCEFGNRITAEESLIPEFLAARIANLADVYKIWKAEKVVSVETRKRIKAL